MYMGLYVRQVGNQRERSNMDSDTLHAIAVVHGEMRNQPDEAKINVISSLKNRRENFNTYWKFRGSWDNMLRQEYYAIRDAESGSNIGYQEAMDSLVNGKKFKNPKDEEDFKRTIQLWGGVMRGYIEPTQTQFYYTPEEEKRQRKSGGTDFSKLDKVGTFKDKKGQVFNTYKYK